MAAAPLILLCATCPSLQYIDQGVWLTVDRLRILQLEKEILEISYIQCPVCENEEKATTCV